MVFKTGTGRQNTVVEVTDEAVLFRTAKSKQPARLSRAKLREAIRWMYVRRTATRREMERFANFSSALLGLLSVIMAGLTKITRTVRGLLRLTLTNTRYFFSGCERDPKALRLIRENGGLMLLMSYFWLREDPQGKWLERIRAAGFSDDEPCVLLDSGAYSLYRAKEKGKEVDPITIEEYAAFIRRYERHLIGWMNLDVIGDPVASRANYEAMESAGLRPVPVWHIESPLEELDAIIAEDHDLVAIGGAAVLLQKKQKRRVRDLLAEAMRRHPDQNFHLLGCSYLPLLAEMMPFSVDGSAPVTIGGNGRVLTMRGQKKAPAGWNGDECRAASIRACMKLEHRYPARLARYMQPTLI